MSEPQKMYRADAYFGQLSIWHPESPCSVFQSEGDLSDCGRYVEIRHVSLDQKRQEFTRYEVSEYWQPTAKAAQAAIASRIRAIGERLVRQADELEAAAGSEVARA